MSHRSVSREPGQCIYCGATGLTKEHVIPQWLHKHLGSTSEGWIREYIRYQEPGRHNEPSRERRAKEGSVFNLQSRKVCGAHCNQGWMKALEDRAKPLLVRLLDDIPGAAFSSDEAAVVATWAAKTAVMIDQTDHKLVSVPLVHRQWIMERDEPPPLTRVWLSRFERTLSAEVWERTSHVAPLAEPLRPGEIRTPNTHLIVFVVGQVMFHVLGTTEERVSKLGPSRLLSDRFIRMWPMPTSFTWPPVADLSIEQFVGCYEGYLRSIAIRA